ncbi:UPF0623 protein [Pteropus alecto]|uniref:UPF0623 protein n=1 Tax=Pteropus alecto TaxID=9402 RepID=L5JL46_PTEAL|nr:UPF0623 protein [Pteropus alecto]
MEKTSAHWNFGGKKFMERGKLKIQKGEHNKGIIGGLGPETQKKYRAQVEKLALDLKKEPPSLLLRFFSGDLSSQLQAQKPGSSENTLTVVEDSGCDLSNEQRTEPSEMSQHLGESFTPIPFLPLPIVKRHCTTPENPLSSHMQFLQHLLELKNWIESRSLKTDFSHFENNSSTVSDSVFQLLDGLITFYREPKFPFSSFWTEAVNTLARLISDYNLSNHILKKCSKKLEEFEKTLLQIILRNNHINRLDLLQLLAVVMSPPLAPDCYSIVLCIDTCVKPVPFLL